MFYYIYVFFVDEYNILVSDHQYKEGERRMEKEGRRKCRSRKNQERNRHIVNSGNKAESVQLRKKNFPFPI